MLYAYILIRHLKAVIGDRVGPKGHIHHPGRGLYTNLLKDLWIEWMGNREVSGKKCGSQFPIFPSVSNIKC